jgi:hypothetical protein
MLPAEGLLLIFPEEGGAAPVAALDLLIIYVIMYFKEDY